MTREHDQTAFIHISHQHHSCQYMAKEATILWFPNNVHVNVSITTLKKQNKSVVVTHTTGHSEKPNFYENSQVNEQ